ncbi:DUF438 domain-containing protein [Mogibacterium pumilum]|uniref:Histidine kinase n=1 Tax=Mogibacterium pumilum TaxID=86332 RepID=A0A223AS52_9FIRM|nr:DUF438 domain-containing protein [Mogibacterium pumilum]ASS37776.1 hypothetical protein AXF17_04470 [Mogibacterium pumilum]
MAAKVLDMKRNVHDLSTEFPEVIDIMIELGFKDISNPVALNTMGRVMTIPKGSQIKGIDLESIVALFEEKGFDVINVPELEKKEKVQTAEVKEEPAKPAFDISKLNIPDFAKAYIREDGTVDVDKVPDFVKNFLDADGRIDSNKLQSSMAGNEAKDEEAPAQEETKKPKNASEREVLLRSYIERLTNGEDLETVRAEFVENFKEVDALEIANAEQHLIKSGVPYQEVQKLCDIHSALFHGSTKQEKVMNAEKAVAASKEAAQRRMNGANDRKEAEIKAQTLIAEPGHPLNVLTLENEGIAEQIVVVNKLFEEGADRAVITEELNKLRAVSIHYAKKGDIIYTILKSRYDVTGPSDVMWTVDDEIRDELRRVTDGTLSDEEWLEKSKAVVKRADEMLFKEANILFPICVQFFKDEEWEEVGRDLKEYDYCLLKEEPAEWDKASNEDYTHRAAREGKNGAAGNDEVIFALGHMTPYQLEAMLNTIPLELTFVDHVDMNRYYNDNGEKKLFKRPISSLDREVYTCHPPTIEPMVRSIISSFKSGAQDKVEVWMNKGESEVLVSYRAVRDAQGNYVGTLECVQIMDEIRDHYKEKFQ